MILDSLVESLQLIFGIRDLRKSYVVLQPKLGSANRMDSVISLRVIQFSKHPFNKIGQLRFAPEKEASVLIGPIIDRKDRMYGPLTSFKAFYETRAKAVYESEKGLPSSGTDGRVRNRIASAALHVLAAEHAGKDCFQTGPYILQHADMHWHNMLFDEQCTIVRVVDWEWPQTVPIDSFNLLPWNFASKMLPMKLENVTRHQELSYQIFQSLSEIEGTGFGHHAVDDILSFQGSRHRRIARFLDDYL